jgi:type I restriction enzyme R subunit/putative DNA methylase
VSVSGSAGVPAGICARADEDVGAPRDIGAPGVDAPRDAPGWYSRGYIPHRDERHLLQFITYRLADSLPQEKLRLLEEELRTLPENRREAARRQKIEQWLDAGMGCAALGHPEVARYVQNSFLHFHGERYHLHAWCVMPNHVHVLIEPLIDLASIVRGWKSFTSRWVLRNSSVLGLQIPNGGGLWMREYWDRYIRDENHYRKTVEYVHRNPVTAGLCAAPEAWPWSSAGSGSVPGSAGVPAGTCATADGDIGAPGTGPC